jgi:broad specificity phosphatase PhoE
MTILLVRHGRAGKAKEWHGDDRLRPLDERGRGQAEGLVDLLGGYDPTVILSSGALRCVQTVEPLAGALGKGVGEKDELAEGAAADDVLSLASRLPDDVVVLCTHGDVIQEVLGEESAKGSTWVLRLQGAELTRVEYLPPAA